MRRRVSRAMPGVTLIMVAGVLTILSAIGAGFYTLIISQQKSASRYSDAMRAQLMAQAGIHFGMAQLRDGAFRKIEDTSDAWFTVDYLHGAAKKISYPQVDSTRNDSSGQPLKKSYSRSLQNSTGAAGSDNFTLEISDASSKININACDNLGVLLDNLCRVIGPPLCPANQDMLQPRIWATLGAAGYGANSDDSANQGACYYMPTFQDMMHVDVTQSPIAEKDGTPRYGDGYAVARYRAAHGRFNSIVDIKAALTVVHHAGHPELETLERELKYAALKDYITTDSWVDTTTVCCGKFEWINGDIAIDRDKSWIEDDPKDKLNHRGSLRGSYVSILTGQGAGQLRRIKTNGVDWIQVEPGFTYVKSQYAQVAPGPLSTYMIVAKEDAKLQTIGTVAGTSGSDPSVPIEVPIEDENGNLVNDPDIDYTKYPLCIHRAPININTASDKVLTAMFMGINITHGHYMSIGTDVDVNRTYQAWYNEDPNKAESRISTLSGLKRVPISSGKIIYDKAFTSILPPLPASYNVNYINNYGATPNGGKVTEAHDLALRVMLARESPRDPVTGLAKPTGDPYNALNSKSKGGTYDYLTGPFKSWDDFYFRVVQPWDELRYEDNDLKRGHAAQMIMAHFNSNTDILKFNPGIEWIDRWGRNFTEMEPVMAYEGEKPIWIQGIDKERGTKYATYIIRNMRYKADEMIDKTDINRSTTEFCFDSGGIFEIRSTGRVIKDGAVIAERKVESLVQIYGVWRETTQRQFVQGIIMEAANATNADGKLDDFARSGKPVRDGMDHKGARLALDTLPEPLVPVKYRLHHNGRNVDVVDTQAPSGRSVYGIPKGSEGAPDVIVNHVQPASYDGQIVLATNTSRYAESNEEQNTFLASYNGDIDTDTSVGNGREQAKSPADRKTRVLDTCGLLGVLNDNDEKHIDYDMQDGSQGIYNTFRIADFNKGLHPLNAKNYWDCVTMRQGDLRPEGVWLGYCGVSGNDGTMKYLIDTHGNHPSEKRKNFNPESSSGAGNGLTLCLWFKPVWASDDNRYHEFLNADNCGDDSNARYFALVKEHGNDFSSSFEDEYDADCQGTLYGGGLKVLQPPKPSNPGPQLRIQPFRWGFAGGIYRYNQPITPGGDYQGYGKGGNNARNREILTKMCRPFINTQADPEGKKWSDQWFYSRLNKASSFTHCDIGTPGGYVPSYPQEAQWSWADGPTTGKPIFGANNLNKAKDRWLYRYTPIDGTMAVVDEYKVSKLAWSTDLISRVMAVSRYYLPKDPSDRVQCPTFTSQSMLQSIRGIKSAASTIASTERTRPIRIAWNCFTPRFMHETIPSQNPNPLPRNGEPGAPFNYATYNHGIIDQMEDDKPADPYGVCRPRLLDYQRNGGSLSHAAAGIEVELLNDTLPIQGESETTPGKFTPTSTFTNPNIYNRFPLDIPSVLLQKLHYRVRFRYPIDPLLKQGGKTVEPNTQYMLDTPVFDDISIAYTIPFRILTYRDISE